VGCVRVLALGQRVDVGHPIQRVPLVLVDLVQQVALGQHFDVGGFHRQAGGLGEPLRAPGGAPRPLRVEGGADLFDRPVMSSTRAADQRAPSTSGAGSSPRSRARSICRR
jgi:hypothetical protein